MKDKLVRVLIEPTGVESVVSQTYFDKYKGSGLTEIKEKPVSPAPKAPTKRKSRAKIAKE